MYIVFELMAKLKIAKAHEAPVWVESCRRSVAPGESYGLCAVCKANRLEGFHQVWLLDLRYTSK